MSTSAPHADLPPLVAGPAPREAATALVLVHGRGGSAEGILTLAGEIGRSDVHVVAPQAAGNTWYPQSFLAPIERNEPGLSSGLAVLTSLVDEIERAGIPCERQVLLGFSQGACLTLEFAARNPRRYGGIVGLTGGLIGPPGTHRDYAGSFLGTRVFIGSSDPDPHVPWWRVEETAQVLGRMGAQVALQRYPDMGHTVNAEELAAVRGLIDLAADGQGGRGRF